jgi:putative IMPACT (imprinted ancient) family translation regulator
LGIAGLIEAYSEIVEEALKLAVLAPVKEICTFSLAVEYNYNDWMQRQILALGAENLETEYASEVNIRFEVPKSQQTALTSFLQEMLVTGKIKSWQ